MSLIIIHKNKEKKAISPYTAISIPQYENIPKYTKFRNFLENKFDDIRLWPSCDNEDVGALEVEPKTVSINTKKCMGCLMCFSTEKHLKNLEETPKKILSQIYGADFISKINSNIFGGHLIDLPYFKNRKTNSFEDFTSIKETTHISLWASSVLNFLASNKNSRVGKEIEIMKMDNPRDGRLDVCLDNQNYVLVCECKVDLNSLLKENRFRIQIPSYMKECSRFLNEYNQKHKSDKKLMTFLIIGGKETDLLPPQHPHCSSKVGNKAERFYRDLIKFDINFISANSILVMMLYSLYNKKRLCWDILLKSILKDKNFIGLVSGGMIVKYNEEIKLKDIPKQIINSAEKDIS